MTILALVIAGTALVIVDITIVTIGLPEIQADLGGTLADVQWVIVAYLVTMGAVTQVVGTLSDRLGRRRVYLTGIVLFTGASLLCGLAPNVLVLDAARVVQGVGGAILMSNSLPILSDTFDGQRRTMAISTWGSLASAAGLVAPLLGGLLIDLWNWRAIFLINVPLGVAALVAGLAALPATPRKPGRGPADWLGTVTLIGALALGNFALLRWEQQAVAVTLVQVGVAAVLLSGFFVTERRVRAPILDLELFRKPAFTGVTIAVFMSRVLSIGGTVYLVQYFHSSLHLSPTQTGLLLAPVSVAQMVAGMVGGKLIGRFRADRVIASGYAAKGLAAAWLAFAFTPSVEPWTLAFPLLVWGIGGGIAGAPVMAVAMNVTDSERAGMVAGTITTLASIGAGVGTAALGVLYQARLESSVTDAISAVLWCSAALSVVTVVVVLALIGRAGPPRAHTRTRSTEPDPADQAS